MYSPASSSGADTVLPTPNQPYSSRRGSLNSPQVADGTDPFSPASLHMTPSPDDKSKSGRSFASIPPPSGALHSADVELAQSRHEQLPSATSMSSSMRRSATGPSIRAPPPPPILLRRPTDLNGVEVEDIPLRTGSSTGSNGMMPSPRRTARGLNIAGIPSSVGGSVSADAGEESDALPALPDVLVSPRRTFFAHADSTNMPKSPAWQSFEASPRSPASAGSSGSGSGPPRRGSTDHIFSPLGPKGNGVVANPHTPTRFEPTPQHGIHARNLSLFFPSPATDNGERKMGVPLTPQFLSPEDMSTAVMPAGTSASRKPFGGAGEWSFGAQAEEDRSGSPALGRSKRRGHHHKHSLSHNFFSFLDPTQTNPALARTPPPPAASPKPKAVDTPHPVPMPLLSTPSFLPGSPTLLPLPPSKNNPQKQLLVSFGVMEVLIGAGLWIEGQMSGWRCLAAIGYLVVFDAIGVAVAMFEQGGEGWRSIRRPYGVTRLTALLYFTQSLFLVFAAVYIAKEAIEQVVLGSGAHEHGSGGGHGHGQIPLDGDERSFPHFLLLSGMMSSAFSGAYMQNHRRLVEAVGPLFLPYRYMQSTLVKRGKSLLGNPFSVTIAGMCASILLGSSIVPPPNLHVLDSSLSLLMTVLTVALAYPPTIAFAHVLLQTAPSVSSQQMKALQKALKDLPDDRRILGLGTMRCWTVGAGHAPPQVEDRWSFSTPTHSRDPSLSSPVSPASPMFNKTSFPTSNGSPESPTRSKSLINGEMSFQNGRASFPSAAGLGLGKLGENHARRLSSSSVGEPEPYTPVVVTLVIHVHPDVSDRDILEITRAAWGKVDSAVGKGGRGKGGGMGEITVSVKRGWEGEEQATE